MKWIRLWVTNTVFGSTFKELDAESRAVWFSLLPLSAVNPPYGEVSICAGMGYTVEQLATLINLDAKLIGRAIEKLKAVGKIEVLKHNVIRICNWKSYQTEYERQKPFRDDEVKERNKVFTAATRARHKGALVDFTPANWIDVLNHNEHKCAYCGRTFNDNFKPTIDHIIPLNRGGTHTIDNIVCACGDCNSSKNDNLLHEWKPDKAEEVCAKASKLQRKLQGKLQVEEEEEEEKKKKIKKTKESAAFTAWWNKYPEHTLKSHALSRWILEVTTPEDEKLVMVALDKYLQTRSVQRGFIMRPSNWLKSWRDWLEDSTPAKRTHKNTPEVEAMLARGRAARRADGGLGTRGGGDGDGGTVPAAGGDETT